MTENERAKRGPAKKIDEKGNGGLWNKTGSDQDVPPGAGTENQERDSDGGLRDRSAPADAGQRSGSFRGNAGLRPFRDERAADAV